MAWLVVEFFMCWAWILVKIFLKILNKILKHVFFLGKLPEWFFFIVRRPKTLCIIGAQLRAPLKSSGTILE